jgi:hypothetical protein
MLFLFSLLMDFLLIREKHSNIRVIYLTGTLSLVSNLTLSFFQKLDLEPRERYFRKCAYDLLDS